MSEEKLTRIENLKRKMYSRGVGNIGGVRSHDLPPSRDFAKSEWEPSMSPRNKNRNKNSKLEKNSTLEISFNDNEI